MLDFTLEPLIFVGIKLHGSLQTDKILVVEVTCMIYAFFGLYYTIQGFTGLDRQGRDMIRVSPAGTGAPPGFPGRARKPSGVTGWYWGTTWVTSGGPGNSP